MLNQFHFDVIFYVFVIDFFAIIAPGPDFLFIIKNSLMEGHQKTFVIALGIILATALSYAICIFGVAILIDKSTIIYKIIKYLGAIYLLYLSWQYLTSKPIAEKDTKIKNNKKNNLKNQITIKNFFLGVQNNLLNPKSFIFNIIFAVYIDKHGNAFTDGTILIILSSLTSLIWFSCLIFFFTRIKVRKIYFKYQRVIDIIFALILIAIAMNFIFME